MGLALNERDGVRLSMLCCHGYYHFWFIGQERGDRCLCGGMVLTGRRKKSSSRRMWVRVDNLEEPKEAL